MRSMTGYGQGNAEADGHRVAVELTAVNSKKQCDIRCSMPRELAALEASVRKRIQNALSRGAVTVAVAYERSAEAKGDIVKVDTELAAEWVRKLRDMARTVGLPETLSITDIIALPGVITETVCASISLIERPLLAALDEALNMLTTMQKREGKELREDLLTRHSELARISEAIGARADDVLLYHRDRLRERMALLGVDLEVDEDRLAREAAYMAERSDINEELVRLRSHLSQFRDMLDQEEVGRPLEFLCQELTREITTICAKSAETELSKLALAFKTELGKLREQIANVE